MKKLVSVLTIFTMIFLVNETMIAQNTPTPQPFVTIGGVSKGSIGKQAILTSDTLRCTVEVLKINSFVLTIEKSKNDVKEYTSTSNVLTEEMKTAINNLSSGNTLYFEQIKAAEPDGNVRWLPMITLKIE